MTKPTAARLRDSGFETLDGRNILEHLRDFRALSFVSCWHLSEHESAAMWRLYLKSNDGIAIRSTLGRFKLAITNLEFKVHLGLVKYVDFDDEEVEWENALFHSLHKRKSFEHEREVRGLILDAPDPDGKTVHVDVQKLVEAVHVAPNAASWIHELVRCVLAKYQCDIQVVRSSLEGGTIY